MVIRSKRLCDSAWIALMITGVCWVSLAGVRGSEPKVPEPLKPWQEWVLRDVEGLHAPKLHTDGQTPILFWPSRLTLTADPGGGSFSIGVETFDRCWVPLPGSARIWPTEVKSGEDELPVSERGGRPAIELSPGKHKIAGRFRWSEIPEKIDIPQQVGILSLTVDNVENTQPTWDPNGELWLKRTRSEVADKDGITVQVYRLIEDGIPIWLRTEIELTVSGKSREEEIGWVTPDGWRISTVESQIPVAIDDRGVMKAQVRPGKWVVRVNAYINRDIQQIGFSENAMPAVASELVGFKANPQFRIAQVEGIPPIDVTQTSFPSAWKQNPVYLWDTGTPFQLLQRMRGMGDSAPGGLTIARRLWLDEDGRAFTYEDTINGQAQQIWRLDVADQHTLGAVRVDGVGQLITENPTTGQSGVEIRQRDLSLSAVGRVDRSLSLVATGWQASADSLQVTLTLPPGWRALAIFGADRVTGDWLTAWSLLDLFLLLVFSFAVFRLSGLIAGVIALLAFALSYHESGAPRFLWLFLLVPLALERVVSPGRILNTIKVAKYGLLAVLLLVLIPFIAFQVQSVLYPQLERRGQMYTQPGAVFTGAAYDAMESAVTMDSVRAGTAKSYQQAAQKSVNQNMINDPRALIQTGPAKPQWDWNSVDCYWNGPVGEEQSIRMHLISMNQNRMLTTARILLLLALLIAILARRAAARSTTTPIQATPVTTVPALLLAVLFYCFAGQSSYAQMPDSEMLKALRAELLRVPDAFPGAAQIPAATLKIDGDRIKVSGVIHAAAKCAVPLPGRLPTWSPLTVLVNDDSDVPIVRRDGYLWIVVDQGVHQVTLEGRIADQSDWEWTYLLAPRFVSIDAPGWKVSGVRPDGTPEGQILLSRDRATTSDAAAYDRTQFQSIVSVDRYLEIGIVSRIRTVVRRLGENRRAISLEIPLIPGERVLTANQDVVGAGISIRMAAGDDSYTWDSELVSGATVNLVAAQTDQWVEKWHLNTSPVWNVELRGLQPIFEPEQAELVPVWNPWPGEFVTAEFQRPVAIAGDVITVQSVQHVTEVGDRRQNTTLTIDLECSLATDFPIELDQSAVVNNLVIDNQAMPVQRRDGVLVIPAKAGNQKVIVSWYVERPLGLRTDVGRVKLPANSSNVETTMQVPESRWVLWASGPQRGPAVRFWGILIVALLLAVALSLLPKSPLRVWEWMLLAIGLTQVPVLVAMFVVAWLFILAYRGSYASNRLDAIPFNLLQIGIVVMTVISLGILVFVVSVGLLGSPDMFVLGNGSSQNFLRWFSPLSDSQLPIANVYSISVWFYRLAMLGWALWLATSLIRWLTTGWQQFGEGGFWRPLQLASRPKPPPPAPRSEMNRL